MEERIKILFVEDDKVDQMAFERFVKRENLPYDYVIAGSILEAKDALADTHFDAVLIDYFLIDGTAFDLFSEIGDAPFVVITGAGNEEIAVKAMKSGASDYLVKDLENNYLTILPVTVEKAMRHKHTEKELRHYREHLEKLVEDRTAELTRTNDQLVVEINQRKRAKEALRESEEQYRLLFNSGNDAIFVSKMTPQGPSKFIEVNDIACQRLGYSREELSNLSPLDISIAEESVNAPAFDPPEMEKFREEKLVLFESMHLTKDGRKIPVEINSHLFDLHGQPVVLSIARDITMRKQAEEQIAASLKEKEVLLKEIHHRVKNNMQVITSLLNLQAAQIQDEQILNVLRDSQSRVKSMALVHERLYQSPNLAQVDFASYTRQLARRLFSLYKVDPAKITLLVDGEDVTLGIDAAIPCGLLINELISNSLKYAFPGDRSGEVLVELRQGGEEVTLVFSDNGVGLPVDLDWRNPDSLGLELVTMLTGQLDGEIQLDRSSGTRFTITFGAAQRE